MKLSKILSSLTESQTDRLMALIEENGWSVTDAINNALTDILSH